MNMDEQERGMISISNCFKVQAYIFLLVLFDIFFFFLFNLLSLLLLFTIPTSQLLLIHSSIFQKRINVISGCTANIILNICASSGLNISRNPEVPLINFHAQYEHAGMASIVLH